MSIESQPADHAQLPIVTIDDMYAAAFDPNDNPNHTYRWNLLLSEQPTLAKELLESISTTVPSIESRKDVLDQLSFAYAALRNALVRTN